MAKGFILVIIILVLWLFVFNPKIIKSGGLFSPSNIYSVAGSKNSSIGGSGGGFSSGSSSGSGGSGGSGGF